MSELPLQLAGVPAIETLGTAFASAAVASVAYWLAKRRGRANEPFDPAKSAATLLTGFVVALALLVAGAATGQDDLAAELALLAGPVAVYFEKLIRSFRATDEQGPAW